MLLSDKQRNVSRLLRSNLVQMGDFNDDTDMVQWGKDFVVKVFEQCTEDEVINFTKHFN